MHKLNAIVLPQIKLKHIFQEYNDGSRDIPKLLNVIDNCIRKII